MKKTPGDILRQQHDIIRAQNQLDSAKRQARTHTTQANNTQVINAQKQLRDATSN